MTSLNDRTNTDSDELMKELNAKWDALENDPEFQHKSFWEQIIEIGKVVPQSEWRKHLPRDFARNFEHYMYGAPKDDPQE